MTVAGPQCETLASTIVPIQCPHISVPHAIYELRAFLYPFIYTTAADTLTEGQHKYPGTHLQIVAHRSALMNFCELCCCGRL